MKAQRNIADVDFRIVDKFLYRVRTARVVISMTNW